MKTAESERDVIQTDAKVRAEGPPETGPPETTSPPETGPLVTALVTHHCVFEDKDNSVKFQLRRLR